MNDDLMDMIRISCDECITADDEAQMEHERGMREEEERQRAEMWQALEAEFGPLHFRNGLFDYHEYDGMAWKD